MKADREESRIPAAALFAIIFTVIFIAHFPLLRLPYFWDEAGYYIPAARDLWLTGASFLTPRLPMRIRLW